MAGSPLFPVFIVFVMLFGLLFGWAFEDSGVLLFVTPSHAYYHDGSTGTKFDYDYRTCYAHDKSSILIKDWSFSKDNDGFVQVKEEAKDSNGCDVFTLELVTDEKSGVFDTSRYLHRVEFEDNNNDSVDYYLYAYTYKDETSKFSKIINKIFNLKSSGYHLQSFSFGMSYIDLIKTKYTCDTDKAIKGGYWDVDYNGIFDKNNNQLNDTLYKPCLFKSLEERSNPKVTFDIIMHIMNHEYRVMNNTELSDMVYSVGFGYFIPDRNDKPQAVDAIRVTYGFEEINGEITARVISDEHIPVSELYMLK